MPIDENWIKQNELWCKGQQLAIDQIIENIAHDKKEVELHLKCIEVSNEMLDHYKKALESAKETQRKHIEDNK